MDYFFGHFFENTYNSYAFYSHTGGDVKSFFELHGFAFEYLLPPHRLEQSQLHLLGDKAQTYSLEIVEYYLQNNLGKVYWRQNLKEKAIPITLAYFHRHFSQKPEKAT